MSRERNAQGTQGTETSKYLQESKETSTPSVAASERGSAQTDVVSSVGALPYRGRGTHTGDPANPKELQRVYLDERHGKAGRRG